MSLYLLFESAAGYSLFEHKQSDELADQLETVQKSISDYGKFSTIVSLVAFENFVSSEQALENINAVSEGELTEKLHHFLERNLPKPSKKSKVQLGVVESKLGTAIQDGLSIPCVSSQKVVELMRGIRAHFSRFIKTLPEADYNKAQLGLSHSYSRCKIKFNINRADNHIIQSISLLDQLDKDINTFAMRVREWYSWHFPELIKIVSDNLPFAKCVTIIGSRTDHLEDKVSELSEALADEDKAREIIEASKSSMGTDISEIDMLNVSKFAHRVVKLAEYRQRLFSYLSKKMNAVAPNLAALIGDVVGARLISHAGSLVNLAKYPASTVQILGAEKALFRALKTRGNTPKYGLIFHSSFIGKASSRDKGRISRYLANKCSIASRIDYFSEQSSTLYGEKMKEQVEERLEFYETGKAPRKNADVIEEIKVQLELNNNNNQDEDDKQDKTVRTPKKQKKASGKESTPKKDKKKQQKMTDDSDDEDKKKKKKKDKKKKKEDSDSEDDSDDVKTKKSKKEDGKKKKDEKKKEDEKKKKNKMDESDSEEEKKKDKKKKKKTN